MHPPTQYSRCQLVAHTHAQLEHTHTHMRMQAHACTHTRTHPQTQAHTHAHMHTHKYACMHARTHAHMHARTHTHNGQMDKLGSCPYGSRTPGDYGPAQNKLLKPGQVRTHRSTDCGTSNSGVGTRGPTWANHWFDYNNQWFCPPELYTS